MIAIQMAYNEWIDLGLSLYGERFRDWKFRCPVCGHVASVADYVDAGASESQIGFCCVGRFLPEEKLGSGEEGYGPCTYTCGGLFHLAPLSVDGRPMFQFADKKPQ